MDPFTYYGDGRCVSAEEAIEIFRARMPETGEERERYQCAVNRMIYCAERIAPVKPRFHKGQYGRQCNVYTCGDCGATISVTHKFCPECGRAIGWRIL